MKDRACFKGGKPGHQFRNCPNDAKANALVNARDPAEAAQGTAFCLTEAPRASPPVTFLGCLGDGGYVPVDRHGRRPVTSVAAAKQQPQPR